MDYYEDESGLIQLLGELQRVEGTNPPVYRSADGMLIGYDRLGQLKVLVTGQAEPAQTGWLNKALHRLFRPVTFARSH